jgi:hypothetical protein
MLKSERIKSFIKKLNIYSDYLFKIKQNNKACNTLIRINRILSLFIIYVFDYLFEWHDYLFELYGYCA